MLRRRSVQSVHGPWLDIVEQANSLFGPGGPPVSPDERPEALLALTDSEQLWGELGRHFYAYPDDISILLTQFLDVKSAFPH